MGGNNDFFENFERNKYLKKIPSMQRVNGAVLVAVCFECGISCMIYIFTFILEDFNLNIHISTGNIIYKII